MKIRDQVLAVYERMKEVDSFYFDQLDIIDDPAQWRYLYWGDLTDIFNSMTWEQKVYYCIHCMFHVDKFIELLTPEQLAVVRKIK